VANRKGEEMFQNPLDFLTQYSETHFVEEEATMARLNSPVLEPNRATHDEFRRKLAEIRA
jgi:hemerythrin